MPKAYKVSEEPLGVGTAAFELTHYHQERTHDKLVPHLILPPDVSR